MDSVYCRTRRRQPGVRADPGEGRTRWLRPAALDDWLGGATVAVGSTPWTCSAMRATSSAVGSVSGSAAPPPGGSGVPQPGGPRLRAARLRRGSAGRQRPGQDQPARGHLLPGAVPLLSRRAGPGGGRFEGPGFQVEAARGRPRPLVGATTRRRPAQAHPGRRRGARAGGGRGRAHGWRSRSSRTTWGSPRAPPRTARVSRSAAVAGRPAVPASAGAVSRRARAAEQRAPAGTVRFGARLRRAARRRRAPEWCAAASGGRRTRREQFAAEFDCLGEGAGGSAAVPGHAKAGGVRRHGTAALGGGAGREIRPEA